MSKLSIEELRWACPTSIFAFDTLHASSEKLLDSSKLPNNYNASGSSGQHRALEAIKLGVDLQVLISYLPNNFKSSGYNIFVSGLEGTQSSNYLKEVLSSVIAKRTQKKLMDQLFIYNFKVPYFLLFLTFL